MAKKRSIGSYDLIWRVVASITVSIFWLVFTLLYTGFLSPGFTVLQSVIIILTSLFVVLAFLASIWSSWMIRLQYESKKK